MVCRRLKNKKISISFVIHTIGDEGGPVMEWKGDRWEQVREFMVNFFIFFRYFPSSRWASLVVLN